MKRKLSNKARVSISNAQHNRLSSKNRDIFRNHSSENVAKKALIKAHYHEDVVHKQIYLGRLLTKQEKELAFLARNNWDKKRGG